MGRSRSKRSDGEYTEIQRIKHENQKLRRENSRLKKMLDRVSPQEFEDYKRLEEMRSEIEVETSKPDRSLKETWRCKKCSSGHLEVVTYDKLGEKWYYRACTNCDNRTIGKRFNEDKVKGIFRRQSGDDPEKK